MSRRATSASPITRWGPRPMFAISQPAIAPSSYASFRAIRKACDGGSVAPAEQTGYQPRRPDLGAGSMSLDKETVARIARLARLKVPDDELAPLAGELSRILAWIEQLNEVDTANVEPMSSVSDVTLPMRADKVTDGGIAEKILANAPGGAVYIDPADKSAGGFFTVPKVVE